MAVVPCRHFKSKTCASRSETSYSRISPRSNRRRRNRRRSKRRRRYRMVAKRSKAKIASPRCFLAKRIRGKRSLSSKSSSPLTMALMTALACRKISDAPGKRIAQLCASALCRSKLGEALEIIRAQAHRCKDSLTMARASSPKNNSQ